jgi:hypothetical protein
MRPDLIGCGPRRDVVVVDGDRQSDDGFRDCERIR